MNRLQPLAPPLAVAPTRSSRVEQAVLSKSPCRGFHHTLFAPLHYEKNYAYPLLVWLHGPGDDERQLQRVLPLISMRNYAGVGPRGTTAQSDGRGYHWQATPGDVSYAEQATTAAIEAARQRFNISPTRIFLAGFQCGGTMAQRIGLAYPDRFAGVLSIGGAFPLEETPLTQLDRVRKLPLFIAHGRDSQEYTLDRSCQELRLFHVAGMNVTLRQYPCGDDLTTKMLSDVNTWVMEQVMGASSAVSKPQSRPGEIN